MFDPTYCSLLLAGGGVIGGGVGGVRGHEVRENIHRYREHYGAVVLLGDAVQCLEVPQLGQQDRV